jgi:hypothetical protein
MIEKIVILLTDCILIMRSLLVFFGFCFFAILTSCYKEEVRPSISSPNGEVLSEKKMSEGISDDQSNGDGSSGTITDPNSDKDDKSRKRNGQ